MQRSAQKSCQKIKKAPMRHLSILCIAAALLLSAGCKKSTAPIGAFSGIYIEQNPTASNLRLSFIGNGKVIVTGGKLNNQYWTSTSDNFNLEIDSPRIYFIDPANSSNSAEYWYNLFTVAGARKLVLSPCPPGVPCIQDYLFVQQP
jgi:hypothetical protein